MITSLAMYVKKTKKLRGTNKENRNKKINNEDLLIISKRWSPVFPGYLLSFTISWWRKAGREGERNK